MSDLFLRRSTVVYHSGNLVNEVCEGDRVLAYCYKDKDGCYITIPSALHIADASKVINFIATVQEYGSETRHTAKETIFRRRY